MDKALDKVLEAPNKIPPAQSTQVPLPLPGVLSTPPKLTLAGQRLVTNLEPIPKRDPQSVGGIFSPNTGLELEDRSIVRDGRYVLEGVVKSPADVEQMSKEEWEAYVKGSRIRDGEHKKTAQILDVLLIPQPGAFLLKTIVTATVSLHTEEFRAGELRPGLYMLWQYGLIDRRYDASIRRTVWYSCGWKGLRPVDWWPTTLSKGA